MHPIDKNVFFHAHSSGGVWKTDDAGQYWIPIGDGQFNVGAMGAIAIAPSSPDIMYVGTGEPQLRDCVSWGDGVYKTADGGKTWNHIGLKPTRHISRVRVHPTNPDLVYVAAVGNPFGPSKDRGVYRSKDGGKTWEQIFFKHEQAGVIDLVMDGSNPDILYASTFQIIRHSWILKAGGSTPALAYVGGTGGVAGVVFDGGFKVVNLGFPFETITSATSRAEVMDRVVEFFFPAVCDPCDMNCDGIVNAFDIEPFLELLFGPNPDPCDTCTGDANGDGTVDAFDIEPFLNCLFP